MRGSGISRAAYNSNRRKKNNERKVIVIIVAVVLLVIGLGAVAFSLLRPDPIEPNMTLISFREYMGLTSNTYIMMDDQLIEDHQVITIGEEHHLSVDFLMSDALGFVGPHLWWDAAHDLLTVTTQTELIRLGLLAETMELNRQTVPATFSYIRNQDMAYVSLSFVHTYFDLNAVMTDQQLLVINRLSEPVLRQGVSLAPRPENNPYVQLRQYPDIQSYVLEHVIPTDTVWLALMPELNFEAQQHGDLLESSTFEPENFRRVRSESGVIGFVHVDELSQSTLNDVPETRQPSRLPRNTEGVPLHIAWDLVTTTGANYTADRRTVHPGVNVMAPKWLRFEGSGNRPNNPPLSSTLENISSADYVHWAHNNGMQVWPLLFDYQDPRVASEILSQPHLRDHVIDQLMTFAVRYHFDGLMMDIEGTNSGNHAYYLQFLRELAPMMREHNLVYSMAAFVPAPWRLWYDHQEIGRVVDYLAVMAYDQNVASVANLLEDATAGPNASIGFVTQAVRDLVAVMDSEQVILGLPFYSRIWYITDYHDSSLRRYRDRSVGIQFGQSYFAGRDWYWSDHYGSYFIDYEGLVDGVQTTTRAWLETERSLQLKADLLHQYNLGGVAGWQRMLASPSTWIMLQETIQAPRLASRSY